MTQVTLLLSAAFLQALVGSAHCIAMCGPISCTVCLNKQPGRIKSAIIYNAFRGLAYLAMALVFFNLGRVFGLQGLGDTAMYISLGLVLLLSLFYFLPENFLTKQMKIPVFAQKLLGPMASKNNHTTAIALGILSALLPCGLLIPAYSLALVAPDAITAMLVMLVFFAGTLPAMTAVAASSSFFASKMKNYRWRRAIGVSLLVLCFTTIWFRSAMHADHAGTNSCNDPIHFLQK